MQKYLTRTDHQMSVLPILIREATYRKLDQADREAIEAAAVAAAETGTEAMFEFTERLASDLEDRGMTLIELTDEEREAFRASVGKVLMSRSTAMRCRPA